MAFKKECLLGAFWALFPFFGGFRAPPIFGLSNPCMPGSDSPDSLYTSVSEVSGSKLDGGLLPSAFVYRKF